MKKRKLTEKEIREIKREYLEDELDMVSGMTEKEKQEIFRTTDKDKIKEIILRGIDGIETTTDVEEIFGVKYYHIYE